MLQEVTSMASCASRVLRILTNPGHRGGIVRYLASGYDAGRLWPQDNKVRVGFVTLSLQSIFGVDPATFSTMVYSPYVLDFVYAYYLIPRVVMMLTPVLVDFDTALLAAAESLGATRWRTCFFRS
jgi:hypothetical protein